MNIGLPDIKGMTDREFILWVCGATLVYLLLLNPLAINQKLDSVGELQAQMVREHNDLLKVMQVQCLNHAENVQERERRAKQQMRCLTLQVNAVSVDAKE